MHWLGADAVFTDTALEAVDADVDGTAWAAGAAVDGGRAAVMP